MRVLYQFPFSPYCEKARWLLDHKELPFVAKNQFPVLHRGITYWHTQQFRLPVLLDEGHYIADSTSIANYLEQHYPEYPLFYTAYTPDCDRLNQEILEIEQLSQQLGQVVKQWLYATALAPEYQHAVQIMLGEKGVLRRFERLSSPVLRRTLQRYHKINPNKMQSIEQPLFMFIADLQQRRRSQQSQFKSPYLVGTRLTLADISCCSMLAPLVMPSGTPWHHVQPFDLQQSIFYAIESSGLGEYVRATYAQHRQARVDWRGV